MGVLQRKRRRSGCTSAPSRHSVKVKCPDWNLDRHKLFEGPCKPKQRESPADEEA